MNEYFYDKIKAKEIGVAHAVEVGVWMPQTSNIQSFIRDGIFCELVEPDPNVLPKIEEYYKEYPNIRIHPVAVYTDNCKLELFRTNASTFVGELPASPALVNDKYQKKNEDKFVVNAVKFSSIDDGTIDALSIDTEGCEWFVLQNLISRPKVISLETHGKKYKNPYFDEILNWIEENNYRIWYIKDSDTVIVWSGLFELTLSERVSLFTEKMKFYLRHWDRRIFINF